MPSKLIIQNNTDLSDLEVLEIVAEVVKLGKISNDGKSYCYGASCLYYNGHYMVSSLVNKKSDRFVINKLK